MPYTKKSRNFESPHSSYAYFFKKLFAKWLTYGKSYSYTYEDIDGDRKQPAIAICLGNVEMILDCKTAFVIAELLKEDSNCFEKFPEWVLTNASEHIPLTSGQQRPKRIVGKRPKAGVAIEVFSKSKHDLPNNNSDNSSEIIDDFINDVPMR